MESRTYTIKTRIDDPGLIAYLEQHVTLWSSIERRMWRDMTTPNFAKRWPRISEYVSHICARYSVLKRTVNSIRFEVQGRMRALMELKHTELRDLKSKIRATQRRIRKMSEELDRLKPIVTANKANDTQLQRYRKLKTSLYWAKNRLNRRRQRKTVLEKAIKEKRYSLCFGSKKLFQAQYRLRENGFRSHEGWRNEFRRRRDRNVYFLGSKDESYGNQMCQLMTCEDGTFSLKLRAEYWQTKYVSVAGLAFKYRGDDLARVLASGQSVSYRFHREGHKWYLQAIFAKSIEGWSTTSAYGVIGLDFNNGFIAMAETDASGNLVAIRRYRLCCHGCGNEARTEMEQTISVIVRYAASKGKDIVAEDLDFSKARARSEKGYNKDYNRMVHRLDYNRYKELLHNIGFNHGVMVKLVDPAYTSEIGKSKYAPLRKLNVHSAAAFVIARRGCGYIDELLPRGISA